MSQKQMRWMIWSTLVVLSLALWGCGTNSDPRAISASRVVAVTPEGLLGANQTTQPSPESQSPTSVESSDSLDQTLSGSTTQSTPAASDLIPSNRTTPSPTPHRASTQPANSTSAPTAQSTSAPSTTSTSPQTANFWGGQWQLYLYQADGSYQTGALQVSVVGDQVIATSTINGVAFSLSGSLLDSSTQVVGSYTKGAAIGYFHWKYETENQFTGNVDNLLAFCASKNNATMPNPCGYYVPS